MNGMRLDESSFDADAILREPKDSIEEEKEEEEVPELNFGDQNNNNNINDLDIPEDEEGFNGL